MIALLKIRKVLQSNLVRKTNSGPPKISQSRTLPDKDVNVYITDVSLKLSAMKEINTNWPILACKIIYEIHIR